MVEMPVSPADATISTSSERNDHQDSIRISTSVEQLQLEPPAERSIAEDESRYPTGATLYMVSLCVGLSLIMVGMGTSMVRIPIESRRPE